MELFKVQARIGMYGRTREEILNLLREAKKESESTIILTHYGRCKKSLVYQNTISTSNSINLQL